MIVPSYKIYDSEAEEDYKQERYGSIAMVDIGINT